MPDGLASGFATPEPLNPQPQPQAGRGRRSKDMENFNSASGEFGLAPSAGGYMNGFPSGSTGQCAQCAFAVVCERAGRERGRRGAGARQWLCEYVDGFGGAEVPGRGGDSGGACVNPCTLPRPGWPRHAALRGLAACCWRAPGLGRAVSRHVGLGAGAGRMLACAHTLQPPALQASTQHSPEASAALRSSRRGPSSSPPCRCRQASAAVERRAGGAAGVAGWLLVRASALERGGWEQRESGCLLGREAARGEGAPAWRKHHWPVLHDTIWSHSDRHATVPSLP